VIRVRVNFGSRTSAYARSRADCLNPDVVESSRRDRDNGLEIANRKAFYSLVDCLGPWKEHVVEAHNGRLLIQMDALCEKLGYASANLWHRYQKPFSAWLLKLGKERFLGPWKSWHR
jgi:biotin operon repressor